jgi:hypothetical protein
METTDRLVYRGCEMGLLDAQRLFNSLRTKGMIAVRKHPVEDYPDRRFTAEELSSLVQGKGHLSDNKMPSAKANSYKWKCRDALGRTCEIVVVFETLEDGQLIVVIHAWRRA